MTEKRLRERGLKRQGIIKQVAEWAKNLMGILVALIAFIVAVGLI